MPKRKHSEYYAVIRGFYITVPTIFSSWGDAHPLMTGCSKPDFHGFETPAEAEDYMDGTGVTLYNYDIKNGAGKTNPVDGKTAYYAVATGRRPGIQSYYPGVKLEVVNFPGACYKHFRTLAQAESFISDWIEMFACVAKAHIKREFLDGHRPANMQEWSLQFKLKKDTDEVEHTLTNGLKGIELRSSD